MVLNVPAMLVSMQFQLILVALVLLVARPACLHLNALLALTSSQVHQVPHVTVFQGTTLLFQISALLVASTVRNVHPLILAFPVSTQML
jgi:hypothetical protein